MAHDDPPRLGIYEKALVPDPRWPHFFEQVRASGFDFAELAVDESAERIRRLGWNNRQRDHVRQAAHAHGVTIDTITLSAHRATPLGSADPEVRVRSRTMLRQAIALAGDLGCTRVQIAGYFAFYEPPHPEARRWFLDGLADATAGAEAAGVVLAIENVDGHDITSIPTALEILDELNDKTVRLYIDVGNLAGNQRDVAAELRTGLPYAHAVQLKDARPGEFRRVPFDHGTVPWPAVMTVLADAGYPVPIGLELWNDDHSPTLARSAADWFNRTSKAADR